MKDTGVSNESKMDLPALRKRSRQAVPDAPALTEQGFLRQLSRVWIRRAMLLCAICAIALASAVPLLSLLKVQSVSAEGASHYEEAAILQAAGVFVGDDLVSTSPSDIEARLLDAMPYLATVRVEQTLRGRVIISVTERTPLFALRLGDGRVALLDDDMKILELGREGEIGAFLCQVSFALLLEDEEDLTPGKMYRGNPDATDKVTLLLDACSMICPDTPATRLDMSDPYNVTLTLSDGTVVAMHECKDPTRQLRTAMDALMAYRELHGAMAEVIRVDVDDVFRVSLRPVASQNP